MTGSNRQAHAPSHAGAKRTRLQKWVKENGFTSAQLETASGISRQSMTKIRAGADARKRTMLRILSAARKLKGPEVEMLDLFDLDPESSENKT